MELVDELRKRIDEILYYQWDPIGVSDEPHAREEYSKYVNGILPIVLREDIPSIVSSLEAFSIHYMGLGSNVQHSQYIAELLVRHKQTIEDRCK